MKYLAIAGKMIGLELAAFLALAAFFCILFSASYLTGKQSLDGLFFAGLMLAVMAGGALVCGFSYYLVAEPPRPFALKILTALVVLAITFSVVFVFS
ncbi:MAG: hypothetical protein AB7O39_00650 [Flavobacteriaceae bacterium]